MDRLTGSNAGVLPDNPRACSSSGQFFCFWKSFLSGEAGVLFSGVPGAYLPFFQQFGIVILAMLPPGVLLGWLFRDSARSYCQTERTLAAAYAVECAGGVLGGTAGDGFSPPGHPQT